MQYINFDNEQDALTFIDLVNKGEGIPTEGGLTQTYFEPELVEGVWCVIKDETTTKYLSK